MSDKKKTSGGTTRAKDEEAVRDKTIVLAADPEALRLYRAENDRLAQAEKDGNNKALQDPIRLIVETLQKHQRGEKPVRMAFESDPSTTTGVYDSLYKAKLQLIPDPLIKKVCRQDDLLAAVLNTRANQLAAFGRPRISRFDTGFDIVPLPGVLEGMESEEEEKREFQDKIDRAKKRMFRCGATDGWEASERVTLSEYLRMFTYDGCRFGRGATEFIYTPDDNGEEKFHSFRNVDSGTIYRVYEKSEEGAERVREQALRLLEDLKNEKIKPDKFFTDDEEERYRWVQAIDNRPVQAFTSKELAVHTFYPVTDVEYNGYPLTPLDTMINAVTTHMNISLHNKLYFQSGRATRGMLVVQAEGVDEGELQQIRLQFNASINSVSNSWRMPVFGIGPEDDMRWVPIDSHGAGRDKEFQFLSDSNARTILAAFQMSPEELPGYAHLSRGTNSQALSESSNEYKLEAARDVGIRPLIASIQDFINDRIMPLVAPDICDKVMFVMVGLDSDDPERESTRLQQDMAMHMTYNEILQRVEKDPIESEFGGDFPLNPQFQMVLDKYLTVGEVKEYFFGEKGAREKPELQYYRDPFWMQWQQMNMEKQQMEAQAQPPEEEAQLGDLTSAMEQLAGTVGLSKSEKTMAPDRRRLLALSRATVSRAMKEWEAESRKAIEEIAEIAKKHKGRGKKGE